METLLGTKLGPFGGPESLKEAEIGAEVLIRARERHPSYYPQILFDELMRSLPCTSLETMAFYVTHDGDVYLNLVPRPVDDTIEDWRGKHHGRGVMLRNSEVEKDGSITKAWRRLINDEVGMKLITGPHDVLTHALDVGGRGKELAWIHALEVKKDLESGVNVHIEELLGTDIIPHHEAIIAKILNKLPIDMEENRFLFKGENGNISTRTNRKIAMKLWDHRNIFSSS